MSKRDKESMKTGADAAEEILQPINGPKLTLSEVRAEVLDNNPRLQNIDLSNSRGTDSLYILSIIEHLETNTYVKRIDLSNSDIGDVECARLYDILSAQHRTSTGNRTIENIDLSNNNITDQSARLFLKLPESLKKINFEGNSISKEVLDGINKALADRAMSRNDPSAVVNQPSISVFRSEIERGGGRKG